MSGIEFYDQDPVIPRAEFGTRAAARLEQLDREAGAVARGILRASIGSPYDRAAAAAELLARHVTATRSLASAARADAEVGIGAGL